MGAADLADLSRDLADRWADFERFNLTGNKFGSRIRGKLCDDSVRGERAGRRESATAIFDGVWRQTQRSGAHDEIVNFHPQTVSPWTGEQARVVRSSRRTYHLKRVRHLPPRPVGSPAVGPLSLYEGMSSTSSQAACSSATCRIRSNPSTSRCCRLPSARSIRRAHTEQRTYMRRRSAFASASRCKVLPSAHSENRPAGTEQGVLAYLRRASSLAMQ
jgi:hypothetical protein